MSKVILKGHIIVPSSELPLVKEALNIHIALTREEAGCLIFNVIQNADNSQRFDVYEEYINKIAFESHQARVKQSPWGELTVNVERHYQIVETANE